MEKESDAMWRIYSPKENGGKIRTTSRKLLNSLYSETHSFIRDNSCFIGKVKYPETLDLERHLGENMENWILGNVNKRIPQSFLFKRREFSHEREVRLIYNSFMDTQKYDLDGFIYLIRPLDLIEEIVFDPRIDKIALKNW